MDLKHIDALQMATITLRIEWEIWEYKATRFQYFLFQKYANDPKFRVVLREE